MCTNGFPPKLPSNLQYFNRQAGGHHFSDGHSRLGFVTDSASGHILKHVVPSKSGNREKAFYENAYLTGATFIPKFYGSRVYTIDGKEYFFLELEDFTSGLRRPNALDIKIGPILRPFENGEDACAQRRRVNYPHCDELAFRLDGFRMYANGAVGSKFLPVVANKSFDSTRATIGKFLHECSPGIIGGLRSGLEEIESWFSTQKSWRFFSASIVLTYDDCADDSQDVIQSWEKDQNSNRCALVDFGYAYPSDCVDEICLKGVRNFKKFFDESLNEC